jgi:male germ cell-associated kinase
MKKEKELKRLNRRRPPNRRTRGFKKRRGNNPTVFAADMDRYTTSRKLGDGAFGSVILATSKKTGSQVAIKHMKQKYYTWEECLALREVRSLKKLKHSNIVKLLEVFRENDELFFVFEYMKSNLFDDMKSREGGFSETEIRNIMFQLFLAVDHMHRHGFFHRDLKPEKCVVTRV